MINTSGYSKGTVGVDGMGEDVMEELRDVCEKKVNCGIYKACQIDGWNVLPSLILSEDQNIFIANTGHMEMIHNKIINALQQTCKEAK